MGPSLIVNWIPFFRSKPNLFTMADVEKKKKKKKKEEVEPAVEAAPEPAAPAPAKSSTKASTGSSKKKQEVQRSGSNVFSMFSQKQVAEFKEGFQLMDRDKDGILSKKSARHLRRVGPHRSREGTRRDDQRRTRTHQLHHAVDHVRRKTIWRFRRDSETRPDDLG